MPLKELLLVVLSIVIGHGIAWSMHNVGLSVLDRTLISRERERAVLAASQWEPEDSELLPQR